jgi:hypothetical protein
LENRLARSIFSRSFQVLFEISEASKSLDFLSLCLTYADWLIARWERDSVNFQPVLRALEGMTDGDWLLRHGGQPIYRKVLDALLGHLGEASANVWADLLSFPSLAPEWLDKDEVRLKSAFQQYQTFGVGEDRDNCDSAEDLEGLRGGLEELNQRHGIDFSTEIMRIDDAIAEHEERESEPDYETSGYLRPPSTERAETVTEDEVREMFKTLKS